MQNSSKRKRQAYAYYIHICIVNCEKCNIDWLNLHHKYFFLSFFFPLSKIRTLVRNVQKECWKLKRKKSLLLVWLWLTQSVSQSKLLLCFYMDAWCIYVVWIYKIYKTQIYLNLSLTWIYVPTPFKIRMKWTNWIAGGKEIFPFLIFFFIFTENLTKNVDPLLSCLLCISTSVFNIEKYGENASHFFSHAQYLSWGFYFSQEKEARKKRPTTTTRRWRRRFSKISNWLSSQFFCWMLSAYFAGSTSSQNFPVSLYT